MHCLNLLPVAVVIDDKIFAINSGISPDPDFMEQIRRIMRPTNVSYTLLFSPSPQLFFKRGTVLTRH
jgi:hypothetical protein